MPSSLAICLGDMPLLASASLAALCTARADGEHDVALLTAHLSRPSGFALGGPTGSTPIS